MQPQFSHSDIDQPIRTDSEGVAVMPEWTDDDIKKSAPAKPKRSAAKAEPVRKRTQRDLQPDATQLDNVTQAREWLKAHPEEAEMLRRAQGATGDILADSGVLTRYYSSGEAASFFDKTVQWLYWGMRHQPHGGRLFVEPVIGDDGQQVTVPVDKHGEPIDLDAAVAEGREVVVDHYEPLVRDIEVPRIGDPKTGKRRFDIPTIRKFATSAYHRGNIKEPKLRAVLERLVVAERGGDWKAIPIPKRQGDEDDGGPK